MDKSLGRDARSSYYLTPDGQNAIRKAEGKFEYIKYNAKGMPIIQNTDTLDGAIRMAEGEPSKSAGGPQALSEAEQAAKQEAEDLSAGLNNEPDKKPNAMDEAALKNDPIYQQFKEGIEGEKGGGGEYSNISGFVAGTEVKNTADFDTLMETAKQVNVSTLPNQAVFYSGKGNRALADAFAQLNDKMTLEMTSGGKFFDDLRLFEPGSPITKDQAQEIWKILSKRYAKGTSGNVFGFVKGARHDGIFNTIEFPAIEQNFKEGKVTNMFSELFD